VIGQPVKLSPWIDCAWLAYLSKIDTLIVGTSVIKRRFCSIFKC